VETGSYRRLGSFFSVFGRFTSCFYTLVSDFNACNEVESTYPCIVVNKFVDHLKHLN